MTDFMIASTILFILHMLPRMKWTACTCGRTKLPWFDKRHEKHGVMIGLVIFCALITLTFVFSSTLGGTAMMILYALCTLYQLKVAIEHGKGKRKWPKKVAGLVRINHHGRLVVTKA